MAEAPTRIARRPPLAETSAGRATGIDRAVLAIEVLPPRGRLSLRLAPARLPAGGEVAGFLLETPINRFSASARGRALRLGPDEWLLWAAENEAGRISADISDALAGQHVSLVDISHGRAALLLSEAEAATVLNAGCPLDLSQAAFPVGAATRTLVGKCEVILARTDNRPTFEVECGRSFAPYLRDFLLEAARGLRARS
jgi:sarcosine oxidase subunit gamma